MRKLHAGIIVLVFVVFVVIMIPISGTLSYYDKMDRDTEKLACKGNTFYDSINNRRCCIEDTDAGATQCVRNFIKP